MAMSQSQYPNLQILPDLVCFIGTRSLFLSHRMHSAPIFPASILPVASKQIPDTPCHILRHQDSRRPQTTFSPKKRAPGKLKKKRQPCPGAPVPGAYRKHRGTRNFFDHSRTPKAGGSPAHTSAKPDKTRSRPALLTSRHSQAG